MKADILKILVGKKTSSKNPRWDILKILFCPPSVVSNPNILHKIPVPIYSAKSGTTLLPWIRYLWIRFQAQCRPRSYPQANSEDVALGLPGLAFVFHGPPSPPAMRYQGRAFTDNTEIRLGEWNKDAAFYLMTGPTLFTWTEPFGSDMPGDQTDRVLSKTQTRPREARRSSASSMPPRGPGGTLRDPLSVKCQRNLCSSMNDPCTHLFLGRWAALLSQE